MNMIKILLGICCISSVCHAQTFEEVSKRLCDENKKGFIIFGENPKLANLVESQPELKKFVVYKLDYKSEIGKKFGVSTPTMYALNKNMVVQAKEELSSRGWKEMKKHLKFKLSEDCILIARPVESELNAIAEKIAPPEQKKVEQLKEEKVESIVEESVVQETVVREPVVQDTYSKSYWTVQLGAYGSEQRARNKIAKCTHVELDMNVNKKHVILNNEYKEVYVVYAGQFSNKTEARQWADKLNGFVYEVQ